MWWLIRKESVSTSTRHPTHFAYYLCKLYISDNWLKVTLLRAGEAVCRTASNIREIAVSIMRLQIQFV